MRAENAVLFDQISHGLLSLVGPPAGHGHHEEAKRSDIHDRWSLHQRLKSLSEASAEKWDTTGTRHVINRAATALRIAATALLRSQSYLGAQFRRFRGKLGAPKATTAMAHKLAVFVYRMLRWGHEYVDKGLQYYEERRRHQQIRLLQKRAAALGFLIVEPQIS